MAVCLWGTTFPHLISTLSLALAHYFSEWLWTHTGMKKIKFIKILISPSRHHIARTSCSQLSCWKFCSVARVGWAMCSRFEIIKSVLHINFLSACVKRGNDNPCKMRGIQSTNYLHFSQFSQFSTLCSELQRWQGREKSGREDQRQRQTISDGTREKSSFHGLNKI